jgi:hypothetical protein
MEMTMNNLDLVMRNIDIELRGNNIRESKTLMHTYLNLLQQINLKFNFKELVVDIPTRDKYKPQFSNHREKFVKLLTMVQSFTIPNSLKARHYKDVNNLVEITQRIESAIRTLDDLNKRLVVKELVGQDDLGRPIYEIK